MIDWLCRDACLREERSVPFVADFGKGTRRSRNGIRNICEITHCGAPLHLCAITDEFAREAAEHRVGVRDIQPLVNSAPDHLERHRSWHRRRPAAEQRIRDISVIEDRYIGRLEGCASFSKLHIDASNWNFCGPEESDGRKRSRIEVMNLIARTGQIDIDSNKGKSALVNLPVGATEHALHESHVRIDERVACHLARFGIGLRHHAAYVRQPDSGI